MTAPQPHGGHDDRDRSPGRRRAPRGGPALSRRRQGWVRRAPLLPALVFTIIITQLPFLLTLWYSLQSWSLVRPGSRHFVGFANYVDVFHDSQFWTTALNTVIMTVGTVLIAMVIGVGAGPAAGPEVPRPGRRAHPADHAVPGHAGRRARWCGRR